MKRLIIAFCIFCVRLGAWDHCIEVLQEEQVGAKYSVTYTFEDAEDLAQARSCAMARAAEIAKEQGYLFFTIQKEEAVLVETTAKPTLPPPPVNLYQEIYIERREQVYRHRMTGPYPTYLFEGAKFTFVFSSEPVVDVRGATP